MKTSAASFARQISRRSDCRSRVLRECFRVMAPIGESYWRSHEVVPQKQTFPGSRRGSLAHTCEMALGGSGSPVLLLQKQAATAIGMATAARIGRPDMPVRHHNVLAIALANKLARIAQAVLNKERYFEVTRTTAPSPSLRKRGTGENVRNVRKINDPPFVINTPFLHEKTPACNRGLLTLGRLRTPRS